MKNSIGILILVFTLQLNAQKSAMKINANKIHSDFVMTFKLHEKLKEEKLNKEINLFLEKTKDSLHSIYIINNSSDTISVSVQDTSLFLIQEAKDKNGLWKPIEYWQYSTCGNSYLSQKIEPKGSLKTESLSYSGNFKTQIRFKLLNNNQIYYSNSVNGNIDLEQFIIPSFESNSYFKKMIKVRGSNKFLFLEN